MARIPTGSGLESVKTRLSRFGLGGPRAAGIGTGKKKRKAKVKRRKAKKTARKKVAKKKVVRRKVKRGRPAKKRR